MPDESNPPVRPAADAAGVHANAFSSGKVTPELILHRAARVEDAIHEFRENRARKRGYHTTVIPYTGYGSTTWIRVLSRVLLTRDRKPRRKLPLIGRRDEMVRGWRSFTAVPINDVEVTVTIDGVVHQVSADRGGVVDAKIPANLEPGWHSITLQAEDSQIVEAPIFIIDPAAKFGVVSDIDDTVMVTALPRPLLAAWNTFVLDEHARMPTPGMAVLLDRLSAAHPGSATIYLSTGAWNVAPTLTRFLSRNLYPSGPLLLTDWGPTHDRLFRSGREHKRDNLHRLAEEFPATKWLLVGDDGQHDEEIYGEFAEQHPESVAAIAIRQLSPSEAVLAGGRSKAESLSERSRAHWMFAPDGSGLAAQLTQLGVL
ncbi:phosphatidate phosphatase APP1 [Subtercola frigoramans]|uniref:Phosphatidate phosphatase APP1 n=1 Tax=Subtercola frigoramans TaxID=120298 RepID=A0ABS2L6D9_9MICO|nr:phosphatidate phosphatase APP1 [Subtercola frigoramans]